MYDRHNDTLLDSTASTIQGNTPVPPSSLIKVCKFNLSEDTLTRLNGYGASVHHVYVAISKTVVSRATPNSPAYCGSVLCGGNVLHLKTRTKPNTEYFWLVDAEVRSSQVYTEEMCGLLQLAISGDQQNGGSQKYGAAILIMMLAFLKLTMH